MRRALVALGLIACGKQAPPVAKVEHDRLAVTITATFLGATASDVDREVAVPLEQVVGQIDGLVRLDSRSTDGATTVVAEFPAQSQQQGFATAEKVFEAVKAVRAQLPEEVAPPVVNRGSRAGAVMRVMLRSDRLTAGELTAVAKRVMDKLWEDAGVDRVEACGTVEPARTIQIDPLALAARGKTVVDVVDGARDWANAPAGGQLDGLGVTTVDTQPRPPACVALDATTRFIALTVIPRAGAPVLEVRDHLEAIVKKTAAMVPATVHLEPWPRTKPLAFEVRFPAGLTREVQLARLQQALPRTGQVLAELGMTATLARDPDAADIRIVAPPAEAAAIKETLSQHELIVLDPTDHVVGLAGADRGALRVHAAAVADALAHTPGLHVVDRFGLTTATVKQLEIDRDAAARLGVRASDIALALRVLASGGMEVGMLNGAEPGPVFVTIAGDSTDALQILRLGGAPLSMFVRATETSEPTTLFRENRMPWVGLRVSGPLDAVNATLAKLPIPAEIRREVREPD